MTISIKANGKKYDSFTDVTVSRSLDNAVSDLRITVAAWSASKFPPGSEVEAEVNGQKVLTGYFSRLDASRGARKTSTTLIVRSKTCDLVDSDAEPQTFVNQTPLQIASVLAAPHNVKVQALSEFLAIPRVRVQPGEKVFATVERALRSQYGLITDNADGDLILTQVTDENSDGSKRRLILGKNLLNINYSFDWDQRFKTIKMIGQGTAGGNVDQRQVAVASDENAERNRLLILVGGAQQPGVNAHNRVLWERNQRIGKAIQIECDVQGWIDPTGEVWQANRMASLTDPSMGWNDVSFLIVAVRFRTDNAGQSVTQLSLRPWKAYAPPTKITTGGYRIDTSGEKVQVPFKTKRQKEWDTHAPVPYVYDPAHGTPWLTERQKQDIEVKTERLRKWWRGQLR